MLEILFDDFCVHVLMLHPNMYPNPWRKEEKPKGVPAFDSSKFPCWLLHFSWGSHVGDAQLLVSGGASSIKVAEFILGRDV